MKIFTGQSLDGWHKVYGVWLKRVFIGVSLAPKPQQVEK